MFGRLDGFVMLALCWDPQCELMKVSAANDVSSSKLADVLPLIENRNEICLVPKLRNRPSQNVIVSQNFLWKM